MNEIFSGMPSDSKRGSGHKLTSEPARDPFFTVLVISHWHRLSREALESPSLEICGAT